MVHLIEHGLLLLMFGLFVYGCYEAVTNIFTKKKPHQCPKCGNDSSRKDVRFCRTCDWRDET